MKRILLIACVVLSGCSAQADGADPQPWVASVITAFENLIGSHPGPRELIVQNTSDSRYSMTEIRALNDASDGTGNGCAFDMGTTGSMYDDPNNGGLTRNSALLVAESGCSEIYIKMNNPNGRIKIGDPKNPLIITAHGVQFPMLKDCPASLTAPGQCADERGVVWIFSNGVARAQ